MILWRLRWFTPTRLSVRRVGELIYCELCLSSVSSGLKFGDVFSFAGAL